MCLYCIYRELIVVFFFNDTATTEIYTLSLHDALPISTREPSPLRVGLMLTDSCAVVVRRLGAFDCERTPAASRQKIDAEVRTTARRLAREATAVLLSYEEGRTAGGSAHEIGRASCRERV